MIKEIGRQKDKSPAVQSKAFNLLTPAVEAAIDSNGMLLRRDRIWLEPI